MIHVHRRHAVWLIVLPGLIGSAVTLASSQVRPVRSAAPGRISSSSAQRLLFYASVLGNQPNGAISYYGFIQPMIEQEQVQQDQQRRIDALQQQLRVLRQDPQIQAAGPSRQLPVPKTSTRVDPRVPPPSRRGAAGFQRFDRYYPVPR